MLKKKTRAIKDGLKAGSSGLQGCIKDLTLEGRRIGFPEVLETVEVRSGCVWEFPCSVSPCPGQQTCAQDGLTGHTCSCSSPPCNDPDTTQLGNQYKNTIQLGNQYKDTIQLGNQYKDTTQLGYQYKDTTQLGNQYKDTKQLCNQYKDTKQLGNQYKDTPQLGNQYKDTTHLGNQYKDTTQLGNQYKENSPTKNVNF